MNMNLLHPHDNPYDDRTRSEVIREDDMGLLIITAFIAAAWVATYFFSFLTSPNTTPTLYWINNVLHFIAKWGTIIMMLVIIFRELMAIAIKEKENDLRKEQEKETVETMMKKYEEKRRS